MFHSFLCTDLANIYLGLESVTLKCNEPSQIISIPQYLLFQFTILGVGNLALPQGNDSTHVGFAQLIFVAFTSGSVIYFDSLIINLCVSTISFSFVVTMKLT